MLTSFLIQYGTPIHNVFDLITTAAIAVGLVRGSSIVRVLTSAGRTAALLDAKDATINDLRRQRSEIKESLDASVLGNEAWRTSMEGVRAQVEGLRGDVADLKHSLSVSMAYIRELLLYIKRGTKGEPVPPVPEELKDEIERSDSHA
jgi:predicted nuclease with TOPRIM domain